MKLLLLITTAASLALAPSCKRAEQKKASAPEAAKTAEPQPAPAAPANPHAQPGAAKAAPTSPHGAATQPAVTASKTADDGTKTIGPFSIKVPDKWLESAPTSSMRVAQFTITGAAGPAELVVYYFKGGGGSIDANLNRWYGQFKQADGSSSAAKASRLDREIGGLPVTTVDVSGRYVAAMSPANPAGPKHDKADHQMLAAIIQTSAGPFFFKLIGPKKTVAAHKGEWDAMIESIKKVN